MKEGSAKPTVKDRARFFAIALGSLREVQTLLDLTQSPKDLQKKADILGGCLYKLCKNPGSGPFSVS